MVNTSDQRDGRRVSYVCLVYLASLVEFVYPVFSVFSVGGADPKG